MSLLFSSIRPLRQFAVPVRLSLRYHSSATGEEADSSDQTTENQTVEDQANLEEIYAYNNVEKKKGKIKPFHTIEEQIGYMKSKGSFFQNNRINNCFQPSRTLTKDFPFTDGIDATSKDKRYWSLHHDCFALTKKESFD